MITFTREQIDEWRTKFVDSGHPQRIAQLGGEVIDYFLFPAAWGVEKGLTNFLIRMTGEPDAGYIVGVSDNVPKRIMDAYAYSEWAEFMKYGLGDRDKTLHAEQDVVSHIRGKTLGSYVMNKSRMYLEMLKGVSKSGLDSWGFNQDDVEGFKRAQQFLEDLQGGKKHDNDLK